MPGSGPNGAYDIGQYASDLGALRATLDPRTSTGSATVRQVSKRGTRVYGYSAVFASGLARRWDVSPVPVRYIKLGYANWYVDQADGVEKGPGAATTVAFSIEYPRGVFTQILWAGAASKAVADGVTDYTDLQDLGFTIPAGKRYWIWTYAANGTRMPYNNWANCIDYAGGDRFQFNTTNNTMTGVIADNSSGANMVGPCASLALSDWHVWGLFGDSLQSGVNDKVPHPSGGQGFFGRSLAQAGPTVYLSIPGDRMQWFAASSARRVALSVVCGVDHAINNYGRNDITNSRTSAQITVDRETVRGLLAPVPVFDCTITPQTTSTDNWKTAANQTIGDATKDTQRTTQNAVLRGGVATSAGLIDVAAMVETDTANERIPVLNGGVWLPEFTDTTGNGTHPASHGYAKIDALVAPVLAQFAA